MDQDQELESKWLRRLHNYYKMFLKIQISLRKFHQIYFTNFIQSIKK